MHIMTIRLGTRDDISGIVALQKANLYENLTGAERERGFVTTAFSEARISELISRQGVFVAEKKGCIAGYAMAGAWDFWSPWPIFPYMVSRLESLAFQGRPIQVDSSFQYGPVCISSSHRGTGLFQQVFEEMRRNFATRYPIGVTFINRINERSLAAHMRKLGLSLIDEFEFSGRNYYGLAFDTSVPLIDKHAVVSRAFRP